ncbi:unnamed protein product [Pleuronectes platessa]|uniref:Uncharacterized protein n=1 Tax=Pleuronectes platessa TaxID=8262 RepID=A0A9N7UC72_PLEPL|nr:unnamed protein product [Pleuronectes platessa]
MPSHVPRLKCDRRDLPNMKVGVALSLPGPTLQLSAQVIESKHRRLSIEGTRTPRMSCLLELLRVHILRLSSCDASLGFVFQETDSFPGDPKFRRRSSAPQRCRGLARLLPLHLPIDR